MPRKIENTTKAHLISVPLPQHGATYTVISHQFVMDYAVQQLQTAGFTISDAQYRCTADGQIAQGIYRLNYNQDPELSMMFAWTNSYNKQVKFKCVVGAYINNTGSVMVSGDIGNWVRKHTGTADTETKDTIDDYITNAHMYYNQLLSDKKSMEAIDLNRRKQSQLLGVLFAEYEILTTEQASMVRDQMKKPLHVFASSDSLWAFYNYVTVALQKSHPRTWMEDQRILHFFISTIGNFQTVAQPQVAAPVEIPVVEENTNEDTEEFVDPNQTSILEQIAETESTKADLDSLEKESSEAGPEPTIEAEEKTTVQELVDKAVANPNDDTGEETVEERRTEYWDQQTRVEEGLDHKGGLTNDELAADTEMQEMKTEQVIEEREEEDVVMTDEEDEIATKEAEEFENMKAAEVEFPPQADVDEEDENPVYDEDQIAERIREDEAAVAEVCDSNDESTETVDEFEDLDKFSLDFNEETDGDQDNVPDFF